MSICSIKNQVKSFFKKTAFFIANIRVMKKPNIFFLDKNYLLSKLHHF